MSNAPAIATVAGDAIDLLTATCEQLDMQAATLRAIRKAYPEVFAEMSDTVRSGLLDTRHLSDLGLNAVTDWREYLAEQASELTAQLDYATENAGGAQ
ncbi:hypothetical protein SAMN05216370_0913 [Pseudomonas peli]|uniref:Phasin protein n=1 Tax=Pseudomonas peli TaxID=592361 RepID=A0AB37Z484_9PSED|nr:hypothetical protein [Pseudomonas peli]NMZ68824.1 hypothetical protein [Pseudomonas peli]SCW39418.1 hypothetical protein SAMN05216370_0913 [Pseudomonas peli]